MLKKLNLGCGRNIIDGWINVDAFSNPGVDLVFNLECTDGERLPYDDNTVEETLMSHVLEHIRNPLKLMEELHRVTVPGGRVKIRVPHGSSDDAFEDPTHVRQLFQGSFGYFGQPYYWRADYGYRGDWDLITVDLHLSGIYNSDGEALNAVRYYRNVVTEMVVEMVAVKPIREPKRELIRQIPLRLFNQNGSRAA